MTGIESQSDVHIGVDNIVLTLGFSPTCVIFDVLLLRLLLGSASAGDTHDQTLEPPVLPSEALALALEFDHALLELLCTAFEGSLPLLFLETEPCAGSSVATPLVLGGGQRPRGR